MLRLLRVVPLLAGCLASTSTLAASPVHKCEVDGKVTYQSSPCPSGERTARPTLEQLNAERKKKAAIAASAPTAATSKKEESAKPSAAPTPRVDAETKTGFRCDGRTHCSQMRSCAEAKYFLANCPGVKMDGDHNGVPCERQWCNP
jgi:hypothetical protein